MLGVMNEAQAHFADLKLTALQNLNHMFKQVLDLLNAKYSDVCWHNLLNLNFLSNPNIHF